MKKLLIGLLSCVTLANAVPIGLITSVEPSIYSSLRVAVICVGTTEYIVTRDNASGGIAVALDKDGKPVQCKVN